MEKMIEIFWTNKAKNDLKNIFLFLKETISTDKSFEIIYGIIEETDILKNHPYIGSIEEQLLKLRRKYRKLIYGHYKIIYSVRENRIYIHTIFDTRQNPNKLKTK